MKIYEALQEMIENKEIIKRKGAKYFKYFRMGKIEGEDDFILLTSCKGNIWTPGSLIIGNRELTRDDYETI